MKVKELKSLLNEADDDLEILIPENSKFDGVFYSPCIDESGVSKVPDGEYEPGDDPDPLTTPMKEVFMILPHGFSDQQEPDNAELN